MIDISQSIKMKKGRKKRKMIAISNGIEQHLLTLNRASERARIHAYKIISHKQIHPHINVKCGERKR